MILAAERMIAVHGVGGVSLRQINEAAGHKNSAATHYHFGSRHGLIQAVLAYRMTAIEARRTAIVETLNDRPSGPDTRDLVSALAHPLVEELKPRAEGNYFLRFSERVLRERDRFDFEADFPMNSWCHTRHQMRRRLQHLPEKLAAMRVQMAWDQIISGLAGVEAKLEDGSWGMDTLLATETLIDFVTAGLEGKVALPILAAFAEQNGDTECPPTSS